MAHHNADDLGDQPSIRNGLGFGKRNDAGRRDQNTVPAQLCNIKDAEVCHVLLSQLERCGSVVPHKLFCEGEGIEGYLNTSHCALRLLLLYN